MSQAGSDHNDSPSILVTGGSGFVGREVVRQLAEHHAVISVYHHRLPEQLDRVFPVCSDMSSPELLAAPLRGVDTVVHLAWSGGVEGPTEAVNWDPATPSSLPENIQILRHLIQAMEKAGTRRLVFMSALGASRKAEAPFLMEKYLAEFFILNSTIPEKVIVRSGIVWGGETATDRFLRSVMRVMKYPVYPQPSQPDGIATIHIDDLAPLLVKLAEQSMSDQASILEASSETLSVDELFQLVKERRIKRTRLPIKGFLGDSLLPLFERDGAEAPKLKDYLVISGHSAADLRKCNELWNLIPDRFSSFRELLKEETPVPEPEPAQPAEPPQP